VAKSDNNYMLLVHDIGRFTDVCVPISRLAECISATEKDIANSFLTAPIVGHAGDGNFHVAFLIDPSDSKELAGSTNFS
jgi:D-lactate dehydrogenase (cytochrome)